MAALLVESPPAVEPVTLDLAKSHLRVTIADDDALITLLIQAARENVERFLSRALINTGFRQSLDSFPYRVDPIMSPAYPPSYYGLPRYSTTLWNQSQRIKLFRSPLVSIDRISYLSSADSAWHDLMPKLPGPRLSTAYVAGNQFQDPNGNLQEVTAVQDNRISGSTLPISWGSNPGDITTWGKVTVTCQGPAPAGDFIYDADSEPARIFPLAGEPWPPVLYYIPNSVQIHYTAGYGTAGYGADGSAVPQLAAVGILQTLASWYETRELISPVELREVPGHAQQMLWGLRVIDLAPTPG